MRALALATMPRRLPPGCIEDRDRHGNIRIYYRAKGRPKVRLRGTPWTPEFMTEYQAAKGEAAPTKTKGIASGTWRWLCTRYFAECAEYKRLDARTQHVRRQILEATYDEPITPVSSKFFRDFPLSRTTADAVLRDRKINTPESANARVKAMRQVFKFGVKKKLAPSNPARDVEYFKSGSAGFHTWTSEEVRQFEERHPVGSKARLALAMMLFTGQRRTARWDFFRKKVGKLKVNFRWWCPGAELNHRHLHFQCSALPTELPGRRSRRTAGGRARGVIKARFPAVQTSWRTDAAGTRSVGLTPHAPLHMCPSPGTARSATSLGLAVPRSRRRGDE